MESGTIEKLVSNLHDKEKYAIYIKNLIWTPNHGIILKKNAECYQFQSRSIAKTIFSKIGVFERTEILSL